MKLQIVDHATALLVERGLAHWSLDALATRAGCAKGLLLYHHRSKASLLAAVAVQLRLERHRRRVAALRPGGPAGIDALWLLLAEEATSGQSAAWLSLVALAEPGVRECTRSTVGEIRELGSAASGALDLEGDPEELGRVVAATLDGFEVNLLVDGHEPELREAYHRHWLGLLG
ncbi:MAG: TetR family transcriptional regulator [Gemmatimonadales bacterium]